jgi:hypothetical protein
MKFELKGGEIVVTRSPEGGVSLVRNADFSDNIQLSHTADGFESLLVALAGKHDLNQPDWASAINDSWEAIINHVD